MPKKTAKLFALISLFAAVSFAPVLPVAGGEATVTKVTTTEKKAEFKRPP
jgi:hypothetical protein